MRIRRLVTLAGIISLMILPQDRSENYPQKPEKLSIRQHGLSNYLWYHNVCGQDYILSDQKEKINQENKAY